jgi:hypothetical protein
MFGPKRAEVRGSVGYYYIGVENLFVIMGGICALDTSQNVIRYITKCNSEFW